MYQENLEREAREKREEEERRADEKKKRSQEKSNNNNKPRSRAEMLAQAQAMQQNQYNVEGPAIDQISPPQHTSATVEDIVDYLEEEF